MRESNSHQRFWRPLSYHLTNPLYMKKLNTDIVFNFYGTMYLQNFIQKSDLPDISSSYQAFRSSLIASSTAFRNLLRISLRPISTCQLHALPHFHLKPINLVVFKGSYSIKDGISHLEGGFTLRCLQRLSLPDLATLPCTW